MSHTEEQLHDIGHYSLEHLQKDMELQREIFQHMIDQLELQGKCRYVYHTLAEALFHDSLT